MKPGQKTLLALGTLMMATWAWASPLYAQDVVCEGADDFPCSFQSEAVALQKVPAIFKFQSRVSQAQLPLGEAVFNTIFVKVMRGAETLCLEQFSSVTVQNSVLNLEIGRNMSCELDEVIAENSGLQFQVCLGGQENCLRPLDLAAAPYAVKSSFASQSQNAYQADIAAQSNYAHRVTADRDLLLRNTLGTGYFDFYTHPAADAALLYDAVDYLEYANSGFIQWTPLAAEGALAVHIVAKDPQTDQLRSLDRFVAVANETILRGNLTVTERGIHVTGNSDVTGNLLVAGQILMGDDPTSLLGFLDTITHGIDGQLQITDATTISAGGIHVTGDSEVQGALGINNINPGFSLDVTGDINFTGNLRRNGEPLAISGLQWSSNEDNDLYYTGGVVGIGTESPVYDLDVEGDVNFTGNLRRNGQVVPISPWVDNNGDISYPGQVTGGHFIAGSGSTFTDLTLGQEGTGLSRGAATVRDLGARQGLRFFNNGDTLAAIMADDGDFITAGDIQTEDLTASGDVSADSVTVTNGVTATAGQFSGVLTADSVTATTLTAGSLTLDTLTLSGGLTAATGTFSGTLAGADANFTGETTTDTLKVNTHLEITGNLLPGRRNVFNTTIDPLVKINISPFHGNNTHYRAAPNSIISSQLLDDSGLGIFNMDGDEEQMLMAIDRFGNVTANGGLYAQQYTTIQGMIIRSDARLKNVIGVSNGASDLQKIRAMEITDYTLRNDKVEPPKPYKMLIAQQVESIYPQAISFDKGLVPDIMLPSQALSFQEDEITVTLGQAHDIAVGDRVVLQTGKKGIPVEVVSVPSLGSFVARGWEGEPVSEVLVYGREVDDLRSVNYDAISMLNVSATQELARKVERLDSVKEEVASLRAENERLRQQVADLEGLRQQVADLEALRQEVNDLDELRQEMAALREVCSQRSENACDVQP